MKAGLGVCYGEPEALAIMESGEFFSFLSLFIRVENHSQKAQELSLMSYWTELGHRTGPPAYLWTNQRQTAMELIMTEWAPIITSPM